MVPVVVQPLASVIDTVCVPAFKLTAVVVNSPESQVVLYGAVPPVIVAVAEPSFNPVQETLLFKAIVTPRTAGSVMLMVSTTGQDNPLVTVTLCRPASRLFAVGPVTPVSQV